jgi:hypothetical protein
MLPEKNNTKLLYHSRRNIHNREKHNIVSSVGVISLMDIADNRENSVFSTEKIVDSNLNFPSTFKYRTESVKEVYSISQMQISVKLYFLDINSRISERKIMEHLVLLC